MTARFLALFDTAAFEASGAIEQISQATGLKVALQQQNLIVLVNDEAAPVIAADGSTVVIGPLFKAGNMHQRVTTFDTGIEQTIHRTRGQVLIDHFWGGYVALMISKGGDNLDVIRDPSGAMPCYYTKKSGFPVRPIASDLETLCLAKLITPSVDWEALRTHLVAYELRTSATCLNDISEVTAGQRVTLSATADISTNCWLPRSFAEKSSKASFEDLSAELKQIATGVIQAWQSVFKHPLLGVSGGLDSSILAAVMERSRSPTSYFTMATDDADGDERPYVRALADTLGIDVHEWFYNLAEVDITKPTSAHLPRPLLCAFGQSEHKQKLALAARDNIDAFFLGVGGDNVFCNLMSASPLLDRLYHDGLSAGTWQTGRDICRLTGCSAMELIAAAIRKRAQGGHYLWQMEADFIVPAPSPTPLPTHPWLTEGASVPPGKLAHIAMLTRIQGTIDGFSRYTSPPMIVPLLAQPLVEFCLSVPTWRWIEGGRNRAPARRAFSDGLPKAVIDRRSKGTPNSFAFEVVERNKALARAQLLDGALAQQGLIDTDRLARVLADNTFIKGFDHMRLGMLLEAEAWARHHMQLPAA